MKRRSFECIPQHKQLRKQMDLNDRGIQPGEEELYSFLHHWKTCETDQLCQSTYSRGRNHVLGKPAQSQDASLV